MSKISLREAFMINEGGELEEVVIFEEESDDDLLDPVPSTAILADLNRLDDAEEFLESSSTPTHLTFLFQEFRL